MRTPEVAVRWALEQVGAHAWEGRCLRFVADAYDVLHCGDGVRWMVSYHADRLVDRRQIGGGNPPVGALVLYVPDPAAEGHVTLSLGDGLQVGAGYPQYPGVVGVRAHPWMRQGYVGWLPPAVFLGRELRTPAMIRTTPAAAALGAPTPSAPEPNVAAVGELSAAAGGVVGSLGGEPTTPTPTVCGFLLGDAMTGGDTATIEITDNSFRRRLPHVTGMADKDDDTWIDVQPIGEAGDQ